MKDARRQPTRNIIFRAYSLRKGERSRDRQVRVCEIRRSPRVSLPGSFQRFRINYIESNPFPSFAPGVTLSRGNTRTRHLCIPIRREREREKERCIDSDRYPERKERPPGSTEFFLERARTSLCQRERFNFTKVKWKPALRGH